MSQRVHANDLVFARCRYRVVKIVFANGTLLLEGLLGGADEQVGADEYQVVFCPHREATGASPFANVALRDGALTGTVEINGVVSTNVAPDSWLEEFIEWVEARGEAFGGSIGKADEDPEEPEEPEEPSTAALLATLTGRPGVKRVEVTAGRYLLDVLLEVGEGLDAPGAVVLVVNPSPPGAS